MRSLTLIVSSFLLITNAHAVTLTQLDIPCKNQPQKMAHQTALVHASHLGAEAPTLQLKKITQLPHGQVFRFRQVHQGLEVIGAEVAALVLNDRLVSISGKLHELKGKSFNVNPLVRRSAAEKILQRQMPDFQVRRAEVMIRAARGLGARVVWQLRGLQPRPFGLWRITMDAHTGEVLERRADMRHALGRVFTTNPTVGTLAVRPLSGLTGKGVLSGEFADVSRCQLDDNDELSCDRLAAPNVTGDYLYQPDDPNLNDPFVEVQAYYHVDAIHRWLSENFGFARQGQQKIDVVTNFQISYGGKMHGYPNAFFGDLDGDGRGDLVFGEDGRDYAYDGDVIYHEFTHSAVAETSDLMEDLDQLGFNAMPGALNEGFADLMSSAFARDPEVGEYAGYGGIRSLVGSASCPRDLSGESHADGQIWGQANWAIRSQLADKGLYDTILYETMASLSQNSSFTEAAAQLLLVVKEIAPELEPTVQATLEQHGLIECSRIITLEPGDNERGWIFGNYTIPGIAAVPGPMQYKIDVPENAIALHIELRGVYSRQSIVGAYIRRDQPVQFGYYKVIHDHVLQGKDRELSLTIDGEDPLIPGTSYYLLPANEGDDEDMYLVQYSLELADPPPPPDAAVMSPPDAGPPVPAADSAPLMPAPTLPAEPMASSGGCSVHPSSPGSASSGMALWALLALLAIFRRRCR